MKLYTGEGIYIVCQKQCAAKSSRIKLSFPFSSFTRSFPTSFPLFSLSLPCSISNVIFIVNSLWYVKLLKNLCLNIRIFLSVGGCFVFIDVVCDQLYFDSSYKFTSLLQRKFDGRRIFKYRVTFRELWSVHVNQGDRTARYARSFLSQILIYFIHFIRNFNTHTHAHTLYYCSVPGLSLFLSLPLSLFFYLSFSCKAIINI